MEENRYKYPRTLHLPWSEGLSSDDRVIETLKRFEGAMVVVTEKMDGGNLSIYRDGLHARSINSSHHESMDMVKKLQASIGYEIPEGWRICGENLYAKHSIFYPNLKDYFLVFSIWNENNKCLSWDDTIEWCELLGLTTVPTLYRGKFNEDLIKSLHKSHRDGRESEGYVVRLEDGFSYYEFPLCIAKYVRANHVQTDKHWSKGAMVVNGLESK